MPVLPPDIAWQLLVCPSCKGELSQGESRWQCGSCGLEYPTLPQSGKPILIVRDASIVDPVQIRDAAGSSPIRREDQEPRLRRAVRLALTRRNQNARRVADKLCVDMTTQVGQRRPLLLVIGGGAVGSGLEELYVAEGVDIIAFDIYDSENVQFLADGHQLPLAAGAVDAVIIQAVLEHVLQPDVVVEEIHRILTKDGVVLADVPFMQQVHEGPYDFTRYTESGLRYLFRRFEILESGPNAGLGTSLLWALDYFVRGLTRISASGFVVRLLFFWLPFLDPWLDRRQTVDGANSVYFYGRRSSTTVTPSQMVRHYSGAQQR